MKPLGVNRVTIAVKDLEKAKELYAGLLGATFHLGNDEEAAALGLQVAMSWDAGIELVSPLPNRDSIVKHILETRGEGIIAVIFNLDDVDQARQAAEERDIAVWHAVDYSQEDIDKHLQGRFKKYKEYMLNPMATGGVGIVLGQIEPK
jgi:catechol 2,3-dioxygenase-like lactoylglutathione lyase family enzyme